jgi:hypothetical protein
VYNDDDNCLKIGFPNGKNQKRNECLDEASSCTLVSISISRPIHR